jgi:hypothetical protein
MRILFGLGGLLVVLAIVAVLSKKQLSAINDIKVPAPAGAGVGAGAGTGAGADVQVNPNAALKEQSQQIQQQYKQAIDAAMQQPRAMPDDK